MNRNAAALRPLLPACCPVLHALLPQLVKPGFFQQRCEMNQAVGLQISSRSSRSTTSACSALVFALLCICLGLQLLFLPGYAPEVVPKLEIRTGLTIPSGVICLPCMCQQDQAAAAAPYTTSKNCCDAKWVCFSCLHVRQWVCAGHHLSQLYTQSFMQTWRK